MLKLIIFAVQFCNNVLNSQVMIRLSIFNGVLDKILIHEFDGVLSDFAFRNHFNKIVECYNCTGHVFLSMVGDLDDDDGIFEVIIVLDWIGSSSVDFAMALFHGLKYSYGLG